MRITIIAAISAILIAQKPINWCDGVAYEVLNMRLDGVSMIDAFYSVPNEDEIYIWEAYKVPISALKETLKKCDK